MNKNNSTVLHTPDGQGMPCLVKKANLPEGSMNAVRKTDCVHHPDCLLKVALPKKAKNFTCEGCASYRVDGEVITDAVRPFSLVKTGANTAKLEENDETGTGKAETITEVPKKELFEMQRPYTLMDVSVTKIDTDYQMSEALYKNLSVSIGLLGTLQSVILQEKDNGNYVVWVGRRRVLAAKSLCRDTIPAMVFGKDVPESLIDIYAVAENMNRANNPGQEAEALSKIMTAYRWTAEEASKKLGIPVQHIRSRIKLMKLNQKFFEKLKRGEIKLSLAKKISSLPVEKQKELLKEERVTLEDVQGICKETKLKELVSLDDLFVLPSTTASTISEIKRQLAEVIPVAEGDKRLLQKALSLIEKYEASAGGA